LNYRLEPSLVIPMLSKDEYNPYTKTILQVSLYEMIFSRLDYKLNKNNKPCPKADRLLMRELEVLENFKVDLIKEVSCYILN